MNNHIVDNLQILNFSKISIIINVLNRFFGIGDLKNVYIIAVTAIFGRSEAIHLGV